MQTKCLRMGSILFSREHEVVRRVRADARDREPYVAIKILSEAFHQQVAPKRDANAPVDDDEDRSEEAVSEDT